MLNKPVSGSLQYASQNPSNNISLSCGNDGVIDQAGVPLNLVHSATTSGGWWAADLQGLYSISRVVYFGRADGGFQTRSLGARILLLNGRGFTIADFTLSGGYIQQWSDISYYAASPTSSPTASVSSSRTPSSTVSVTSSASTTASPSKSIGATPTATSSTVVDLPAAVRISVTNNCINLVEVLAFSSTGRLLNIGSTATSSSVNSSGPDVFGASNGNDLCMETTNTGAVGGTCSIVSTECLGQQWFKLAFGPTDAPYSNGYPTRVGAIYTITPTGYGQGAAMVAGGGNISLVRSDNSLVTSQAMTSLPINAMYVNPITLPPPALSVANATDAQKAQLVASVRIKISQAVYLNFK